MKCIKIQHLLQILKDCQPIKKLLNMESKLWKLNTNYQNS